MTKQIQQLVHQDVKPHIRKYVINSFPVGGTTWDFEWWYDNGTDTVRITLSIDGKTEVHQVPVLDIVD